VTAEESAPPRIAPADPADLDDDTAALLALTQIVTAVVVADGPTPPTLDELVARCGDLAPYARPRRVEIVDDIPRTTATGQIDRSTLADRLGG
jgi:acyl-coenzyme A synthetase/AMP-(fatty) acid ligase